MSVLSTHSPIAADLPPIMVSVQTTPDDLRRSTRFLDILRSLRMRLGKGH